jgi:hypothetical protein
MTRRDAFSKIREIPSGNNIKEPNSTEINQQDSPGKAPIDLIPIASKKKKRARKWEQDHNAETVTYRGVPKECQNWIEEISNSIRVPRDEVVRACLEYGFSEIKSGKVSLVAYPKSQRMTLFPDGGKQYSTSRQNSASEKNWLKDVFPSPGSIQNKRKKSNKDLPPWQVRVTYRIPVELKEQVRLLASENHLPVGEIVWFFILKAMMAYQTGVLHFEPVPKMAGRTLFQEQRNF